MKSGHITVEINYDPEKNEFYFPTFPAEVLQASQSIGNVENASPPEPLQLDQELILANPKSSTNIELIRSPHATALGLEQHIVRHSPTGIEWGYGGSGPADLALSILTQYAGQEFADRHYQQFKFDVIASIPRTGGTITAKQIEQWIASAKAQ